MTGINSTSARKGRRGVLMSARPGAEIARLEGREGRLDSSRAAPLYRASVKRFVAG